MADVAGVLGDMEARLARMEVERQRDARREEEAVRALDRLSRVLEEAIQTVAALRDLFQEKRTP